MLPAVLPALPDPDPDVDPEPELEPEPEGEDEDEESEEELVDEPDVFDAGVLLDEEPRLSLR
ncbi:hypothetical protein A4U61_26585 [Streptomyces sp. H-KF8]|nr:hypothetical protein A4U61_26585 [Streptomyces sp. H-KF8]